MASGCAPNLNYNTYTADGIQTCYLITFDYHDDEDIRARLDGVELDNSTYRITPGQPSEVCFDTPPSGELTIYRCTDLDALSANFYAGSTVRAVDLNDNFEQLLYGVQDANNRILTQSESVTVDLGYQGDGPENPGQVTNTRGTNATIPIVDTTRSGLMAGSMFDKLDGLNTDTENADIYLSSVNNDTAQGAITFENVTTHEAGISSGANVTVTSGNISVPSGSVFAGGNPTNGTANGARLINSGIISVSQSSSSVPLFNAYTTGTSDPVIGMYNSGNAFFQGDVGIGTTSPSSKLHIQTPAGTNCRLTINEATTANGLILEQSSTQSLIGTNASQPLVIRGQSSTSSEGSHIQFKTRTYERMRIAENGNIGMNTDSPTSVLHISAANSAGAFKLSHSDVNSFWSFGRDSAGGLRIQDDGTERIRLLSDGNVNVKAGITFGSRTSVLNDYESGTFTPTLAASGGGLTVTLGTAQGRYTKIGNRVFYEILMTVSSVSGSGSGNLRIAGLPFQSINTQNGLTSSGGVGYSTNWSSTDFGGPSHYRIRGGVVTIDLYRQAVKSVSGGGYVLAGMSTLNWQAVQANAGMRISGNYRTS